MLGLEKIIRWKGMLSKKHHRYYDAKDETKVAR